MQIKISLVVCEDAVESDRQSLLTLEVNAQPTIATLGLSLADGKAMLAQLQAQVVTRQVELLVARQRRCENCGLIRTVNDYHDIHYGSLFGNVHVPRWRRCACSAGAEIADPSWSALDLGGIGVRAEPIGRDDSLCQVGRTARLLLSVAGANAPSTVREHPWASAAG